MFRKKIAFDRNTPEISSYWALIFYLYSFQFENEKAKTLDIIDRYIYEFPNHQNVNILYEIRMNIDEYERFSLF